MRVDGQRSQHVGHFMHDLPQFRQHGVVFLNPWLVFDVQQRRYFGRQSIGIIFGQCNVSQCRQQQFGFDIVLLQSNVASRVHFVRDVVPFGTWR